MPLLGGTLSLLVVQAATSSTGYFYWLVGARSYSAHDIGEAASITSISILVALVAGQAIVASMIVRLPRIEAQRAVLASSALVAGAVAAAVAVAGLVTLLLFVPALGALQRPAVALAMIVVCVSQTVGLVVDGAAFALGRFRILVGRNATFGVGKLALAATLAAVGMRAGTEVLVVSWAVAGTATSGWALWRLWRITSGSGWSFSTIRPGLGYQTITAIGGTVPAQLLPTVVAAQVGASLAGDFSLTWLLGGLCFSISPAVAQAMLVTHESDLQRSTRHAGVIIGIMLVVPVTLFLTYGGRVLGLFGPSYSRYGEVLLIWLAISTVPNAITNVAVARWRVRERLRPAAAVNGLMAAVTLALVIGPLRPTGDDLGPVGLAWLIAQSAGCGFVFLRAVLLRPAAGAGLEAVPVLPQLPAACDETPR
ncbi:MAG: lipopolysaccharide biosynthesis protein [Candidatus Limnocylindrales bacterium]